MYNSDKTAAVTFIVFYKKKSVLLLLVTTSVSLCKTHPHASLPILQLSQPT